MYRRPDDEAAKRDRAAEARELDAFGRRVRTSPSRRLGGTTLLVLGGLLLLGGGGLLFVLWTIAEALPHGDPTCIQTLPDGNFEPDRGCVNGQRIPQVPRPATGRDGG